MMCEVDQKTKLTYSWLHNFTPNEADGLDSNDIDNIDGSSSDRPSKSGLLVILGDFFDCGGRMESYLKG